MTIAELLEQAKALTPEERKTLVQLLLEIPDSTPQHRLSELRGLGKDIWKNIDAQEYVDQLRDEWEDRP